MSKLITLEMLKGLLCYEPETGDFRRLTSPSHNAKAGSAAGCLRSDSYLQISVGGEMYLAHRLAWLYAHGEWPPAQIDHINGIRDDNRLCNLRLATPSENQQNQRVAYANNTTGLLGVSARRKKFMASIQVFGNRIRLGVFPTKEIAHSVYLKAKRYLHKGCTI